MIQKIILIYKIEEKKKKKKKKQQEEIKACKKTTRKSITFKTGTLSFYIKFV